MIGTWESHRARRLYPPFSEGQPSDRNRKEGLQMITYSEFIQTGIFIVALIGLCYTIFKGSK